MAAASHGVEPAAREQTRARYPDETGFVERDGVRVFWERYGEGSPTILLMPSWSIVHSRLWKGQIPYLARPFRVVAFDGRGNGRSDRPPDAASYADTEFVADALAILDATGTDRAVVVGLSMGAGFALRLAVTAPERVMGLVLFGSSVPVLDRAADAPEDAAGATFEQPKPDDDGLAQVQRPVLASRLVRVRPLVRRREDLLRAALHEAGRGHDRLDARDGPRDDHRHGARPVPRPSCRLGARPASEGRGLAFARRIPSPALVVHGTDDHIIPLEVGRRLARTIGAPLVEVEGGGHSAIGRDPVLANLLIRDFVAAWSLSGDPADHHLDPGAQAPAAGALHLVADRPRSRAARRRDRRRAAQLQPDLEIDWLAQPPVTTVLEARGERIHPLSAELASESAHVTNESSEHDLNAFQAIRRMDEILVANFMVFHDAVDGRASTTSSIGDEAWDVDYFLHENPELKRTAFAWMTDFVGLAADARRAATARRS